MTKILAALALLLALSGCVATHFTTADLKKPSLIAEPVFTVAIPAEFAAYRDEVRYGEKVSFTFPTGDLAKKLFAGSDDAPATLILVTSQLTVDSRDEFPLPIIHTTARYSISCVLARGGQKIPLSATAEGKTAVNVAEASREAVERALLDLSKQIAAI